MLVNICMKFHEDTCKVAERTRFCLRNCYLQSLKGHNSKSINTRVMVLAFCMSSNICMKFQEGILNGFQVTEWTCFCDGQTDGRTDHPGKKTMSPNPKVGRHNDKTTLVESKENYRNICPLSDFCFLIFLRKKIR